MPQRKRLGRSWGENVKHTNDVENIRVHVLAWGMAGSGKTHLIGTAPKPFVIAPEKGLLTLHRDDIPYIEIDDDMAIYDAVMTIFDSIEKRDPSLGVDFDKVETLAIDSLWKLAQMIKEEIDETAKDSYKAWDMLATRMNKIVSKSQSLGFHTIATSGEAVKADKMDESLMLPVPNMQGGFRDQVMYLYDINLYMKEIVRGRNRTWKAYTRPENKRTAKSRVHLPDEMDNPSFQTIIDEVKKGLKENSEK